MSTLSFAGDMARLQRAFTGSHDAIVRRGIVLRAERLTRIDPSLAVRALAWGDRFPLQVRVADVIGMVAPSSPRRGGGRRCFAE